MVSELGLYILNSDNSVTPFPSKEEQITLYDFSFEAQRMGAAPEIQASIPAGGVLESTLTTKVFCEYNGERYYLKNPPSSSKDNADPRYNFELTFVSERTILDTVYMIDAVQGNSSIDRPQSNSTNVVFMATIQEYVGRLNAALAYAGLDYSVVLDEGATSESVLVSFQDKFFTEALQEGVKLYHIPYYYVGKVIHFGVAQHILPRLKYGDGLLRVTKTLRTDTIVTRATATGSSENIPYYYPNPTPKGFIEISNPQELDITFESALKLSNIPDGHFLGYREVRDKVKLLCQYSTPYVNNYDTNVKKGVFESDGVIGFDGLLLVSGLHVSSYEPTLNLELSCSVVIEGNIVVTQDQIYNSLIWVEREGQWGMTMDKNIEVKKSLTSSEDEAGNLVWRISVNVPSCPTNEDILVVIALNNRRKYKNDYPVRFSFLNTQIGQEAGWYIMDATGAISSGPVNIRDYGLIVSTPPREGDKVSYNVTKKIPYASNLMPPIYRDSDGVERFYNAINGQYGNLVFENEYHEQNRKEAITSFEKIKPTIVGITNSAGDRIDMFVDFAYDLTDNDETVTTEESSEYLHPYFYAKLRKFDGAHGFNLFAQAIESGEMTIEMTSGVCGACKFVIAVDENTQRNLVLVDEEGNLVYDDVTGKVKMASDARGLDQQNDTRYNEVWVALKKDFNTYGQIMPNVAYNHKPSTTDTFVITNILLPEKYIKDAEKRLEDEIIAFLFKNNAFKFDHDIDFSRIFLKTHKDVTDILSENTIIPIEYNGNFSSFYVTSFTYQKRKQEVLPEISVSLTEDFETEPSSFQSTISAVEENIVKNIVASGVGANVVPDGRYLRKDIDDSVKSRVTFEKGITVDNDISSPDFQQGDISGAGFAIYTDNNGNKVLEIDRAIIRKDTKFNEVVINQTTFQLGATVFSGGGCNITDIQEIDNVYRCFYDNKSGTRFSGLVAGDQVRCQRYDASHASMVKYYWRVVANVGDDYVDLYISGVDANGVSLVDGTDIPEIGDDIVHFGNRTDTTRQSAIIINPLNGGSVEVYAGINSFSLEDKNYVGMGVNPNTQEAYLYGYGDIYIGDRDINADGATFVTYQKKEGDNKRKVFISADISLGSGSTGLSNLSEFQQVQQGVTDATDKAEQAKKDATQAKEDASNAEAAAKSYADELVKDLQDQLDGKVESFFYDYDPTLENIPASKWTTAELKAEHLNDTFTNTTSGRSWRWLEKDGVYQWVEIADTQSAEALAKAQEALKVANNKVAVFVGTETPQSPYNEGDFWLVNNRIKRSVETRTTKEETYINDWVFAEDSHEYTDNQLASYRAEVDATVEELDEAIANAEANANKYTDEGKVALQASITALNNAKANIAEVYTKAAADEQISQAEANAIASAKDLANAAQALAEGNAKFYADNEISASEAETLKKYQEALAEAQDAMAKANEAMAFAEDVEATTTAIQTYLDVELADNLQSLQNQIDGAIDSYFEDYEPTTDNEPAVSWDDAEKEAHLNDTFTNLETGASWRWSKDGNVYKWVAITDTATQKALAEAGNALTAANSAQKTADDKIRTFVGTNTPTPPYDKGDLWVQGTDGDIMVCVGGATGGYEAKHWEKSSKYTDDTAANEAQKTANEAKEALAPLLDDGIITKSEKASFIAEYRRVVSDDEELRENIERYQLENDYLSTIEDYRTKFDPYWLLLEDIFDSSANDFEIDADNFLVLQREYYSARTTVLNLISAASKGLIDASTNAIARLADDGIISEVEKPALRMELEQIKKDLNNLFTKWELNGYPEDWGFDPPYYGKYETYRISLQSILDAEGDVEIDAEAFKTQQTEYYKAYTNTLNISEQTIYKKSVTDIQYLKQLFPNALLDVNGATLAKLLGVKNDVGNVVAGLYGGADNDLNENGFEDGTHGTLMFFAGAENGISDGKVASAATRIYDDGTIYTNKLIATNADISGKIVSSEGEIGGFEIKPNGLNSTIKDEDGKITFGMLLRQSDINFIDVDNSVYAWFGSSTLPASLGGLKCALRIENGYDGMEFAPNYGIFIDVQGSYYKNSNNERVPYLNYAIYANNGDFVQDNGVFYGLRPNVSVVTTSKTLSKNDNIVYVFNNGSAINITLPSGCLTGQMYVIRRLQPTAQGNITVKVEGDEIIVLNLGLTEETRTSMNLNDYKAVELHYMEVELAGGVLKKCWIANYLSV